jgi:DNA polymerase III subunit gamma/tau
MPYEPLHHKYRPQSFAELVGQRAIAATLSNALQQQRIAPAYLFTGPRGTGKTSSARILAKSLNCIATNVPTAQPCGVCETCREITKGAALDVIEIDAASNTGVDNIREIIERSQFAPVRCRYKVYVIDEVHMLSTAAFNALLKTLEEPPDRVVFILATTDPQKVLPTIISRCQRFDFRRIPLEDMVEHLGTIAHQESIHISPDAVQLVAQISQGGLRDAESLLDQLSLLDDEITVEKVWDLVGAVPERDLLALVKAIAQNDAAAMLDQARHLMNRGREPLIVLQYLASFYRDLLIAKTTPDRGDLVAMTPPTWQELCDFARSLPISAILSGQQHLRESEVQIKNTTQPRLWLEVTLMGLLPAAIATQASGATVPAQPSQPAVSNQQPIRANPTPPVSAPAQVNGARPQREPPPVVSLPTIASTPPAEVEQPTAQPEPPEPAELPVQVEQVEEAIAATPPETTQVDLAEIWQQVLSQVQPYSTQIMLRQQCYLLAFNGREARVGTKSQPLFKMAKDRLPNVEAAFAKCFQNTIRVSLEVIPGGAVLPSTVSEIPSTYGNGSQPPSQTPAAQNHQTTAHNLPSPEPSPLSSGQERHTIPSPTSEPAPLSTAATAQPSTAVELPTPLVTWQEEDEVMRAAKSLAQMFNGQIVSLNESLIGRDLDDLSLGAGDLSSDEDTDDVPF